MRIYIKKTALLLSSLLACATTRVQAEEKVTIAAAISLKPLFDSYFEKQHRGNVEFIYSGSQILVQQFNRKAPFDIFMTAEPELVEKALTKTKGGTLSKPLFYNPLRLAVRTNEYKKSVAELLQSAKRIALGNPEVPAGKLAGQYLTEKKLTATVKDRLVQTENVAQVTTYVERGAVDVGFIYASECQKAKLTCLPLDSAKPLHAEYVALATDRCKKIGARCAALMQDLQTETLAKLASTLGYTVTP